jgi:hypothetical protein
MIAKHYKKVKNLCEPLPVVQASNIHQTCLCFCSNSLTGKASRFERSTMVSRIFSVYDFVICACAKPSKIPYCKTMFFRLVQDDSECKDKLNTFCISLKFHGNGQQATPCMTIQGIQLHFSQSESEKLSNPLVMTILVHNCVMTSLWLFGWVNTVWKSSSSFYPSKE